MKNNPLPSSILACLLIHLHLALPAAAEVVFTRVTNSPVATSVNGTAAAWGDYNNDGWVDLYVTTLNGPAYLFRNNGNGTFSSVTGAPVVAGNMNSFGCAWGDYDNDGFLDLLQGGYNLPSRLFRNNGDGSFTQITSGPLASIDRGANNVLWGDYDNDGWLDLFVANDSNGNGALYHNNGDGTFTAVTGGAIVNTPGASQGACWGDFDNDGFPDLFVPNRSAFNNYLYHNEGNTNAWLTFKLEGRVSNRAAIGAKVRLRAVIGGRTLWQMREVSGGGSLGSQNEPRAAFGLGDATNAEVVRVEWPSGIRQEFQNLAPRQILTVVEPEARITPAAAEVPAGGMVALTISASWPAAAAFQWRLNGAELAGQTNATLLIAHAGIEDAGVYTVTVTDPATGASYNSFPAKLTGPVVIEQPPNVLNLRPGSNGWFSVTVSGAGPITYQWRFNGVPLLDETNATLTIANATAERVGSYDVVLANSYGPVVSPPASFGLLINPVITAQPVTQTVPIGGSVTLSVAVSGSPAPFSFEWHRGSVSIGTNVTSEPISFLSLSNVQAGQAGPYRVVIRNPATPPNGLVSSAAILSIALDADGDGLPDDWEISNGFSATDAGDAILDADGDGATNLQEFMAGTEPRDGSSRLRIEQIGWNSAGVVLLQFTAKSNKTYTVRASPATIGAAWARVADVPAAPTNRTVVVTDPAASIAPGQRFYQLASPRLP